MLIQAFSNLLDVGQASAARCRDWSWACWCVVARHEIRAHGAPLTLSVRTMVGHVHHAVDPEHKSPPNYKMLLKGATMQTMNGLSSLPHCCNSSAV